MTSLQVIARALSPMWLRIGGTETDYVTFVPPISYSSPSSSNHYFDEDSEQGDNEEDALEYSGHDELGRGSGYKVNPPPPVEARQIRNGKRTLPNPNYDNDTSEGTPQNFKIHCRVEEEGVHMDENSSPVAIELLPYEVDRLHEFAKNVGWKVIFALNVQLRGYLDWDVSNAVSLIDYSLWRGYKTAWELGNGEFVTSCNY